MLAVGLHLYDKRRTKYLVFKLSGISRHFALFVLALIFPGNIIQVCNVKKLQRSKIYPISFFILCIVQVPLLYIKMYCTKCWMNDEWFRWWIKSLYRLINVASFCFECLWDIKWIFFVVLKENDIVIEYLLVCTNTNWEVKVSKLS